jgi:predicted  nucleic acid-binding Zn-ribbon protein
MRLHRTLSCCGWISQTSRQVGLLFMFRGAIAGFISMGLKYHSERMAKDELDDFRHQMDIIRQQMKRAKQERDEIEQQLPASVTQWDLELKDAETRLMMMEDLVPLENRVQATRSTWEEIKRRIQSQERELSAAKEQWQASLRTAGLPETLQPQQLKEITQRSERISGFHARPSTSSEGL